MRVTELLDRSATAALERAASIQIQLRESEPAQLGDFRDQMHMLVADIVSLRNAAELLKRQSPAS